jgi:putative ABC transport system permease protein
VQASGVEPRACLQDAAPRHSHSRRHRYALAATVVCEISLALMLLIGAGLLGEAFYKVLHVDPGFRPQNVVTFGIDLPTDTAYKKPEQQLAFYRDLLAGLRALPGVEAAGATQALPLGGHWGCSYEAEGDPPFNPNEIHPTVFKVLATPGYFDAIGTTFLAGRQFDQRDGEKGHDSGGSSASLAAGDRRHSRREGLWARR